MGNPGPAGIGVVIYGDGQVLGRVSRSVGVKTNNEAEYLALIYALKRAVKMGVEEVELISDSKLLVKQLRGEYRVRSPRLKSLHRKASRLTSMIPMLKIIHVGRGENREADRLAKRAAKAAKDS